MNTQKLVSSLWLPALGLALFLAAVICRPLLPIDETRYMSVAWEMSLHQGWFDPLTKNFEPYSHKPPLLFWLINAFWSVFGISRWAGTLPVIVASVSCIYLTTYLGKLIARNNPQSPFSSALSNTTRTALIMAASFPFMIYGTLVMFDFLVAAFVLLSLIFVIRFAEQRRFIDLALLGLCLGFGVLAKGPVAYLYVLPAYLLAPLWKSDLTRVKSWYACCLGAILISAAPVLLWLIPVLNATDNNFAFWLVWNQTAGRVTGNFSEAHVRPVYFYLPLLIGFMMPWILFPAFWRSIRQMKSSFRTDPILKFITCLFVPVFIAFSLISGKQPHYMVPLVPAMVLLLAITFERLNTKTLIKTLLVVSTIFIGGQFVAKNIFFHKYDLDPVVEVIHQYPNTPMAYVYNYHAEFSFLARRTSHIDDVKPEDLAQWFDKHPDGVAIIRIHTLDSIKEYHKIFSMEYRGRILAVISKSAPNPSISKDTR